MSMRNVLGLLILLGTVTPGIHADYVRVHRLTIVRADPTRDSDTVFAAPVGANLQLLQSEADNGYYHVKDTKTGQTGWIYRSFVRRYAGEVPAGGSHSDGRAPSGRSHSFRPDTCSVPYNEEAGDTSEFDRSCGLQGDAEDGTAEAVQNPHKNNLCATGNPHSITVGDLVKLQAAVDDSGLVYGSRFRGKGPPLDRSPLQNLPPIGHGQKLGEGDVVSFVGYLVEAHYMPKSESKPKPPRRGGESVNCHSTEHEKADIHLALSSSSGRINAKDPRRQEKFCQTISAELIPHLRPAVWDTDNLNQMIDLERPVRVEGQLFFDGSHEPCRDGAPNRGDPARVTVWEIHPVYTVEICKFDDIHKCDSKSASVWQPLSQIGAIRPAEEEEQ